MYSATVNFSETTGKVKPLHGLNRGPLERGFSLDRRKYFKEAHIPYSRLHNVEAPFGVGEFVDIPAVFKNFDSDVNNPSSYNFHCTDAYIKPIKECSTEIIYRLGVSSENAAAKGKAPALHTAPPKDYLKWAKICEHIIMHYNEGWADGFNMNIQYWEIWTEPENNAVWTGSFEEYVKFYNEVTVYLKNRFPNLKFGGYGSSEVNNNMRSFLTSVKENIAPLDFFSWKLFSDNVYAFAAQAENIRTVLDEYGFSETKSVLAEWNKEDSKKASCAKVASLCGGVMCALQKSPVDIAAYHSSRLPTSCNDVFDSVLSGKTQPYKAYYSFRSFGELYNLENSVYCDSDSGIFVCAAKSCTDGEPGAVLLVNCSDENKDVGLDIFGRSGYASEVITYLLDEENDMEKIKCEIIADSSFKLFNTLGKYCSVLIKIKDWNISL